MTLACIRVLDCNIILWEQYDLQLKRVALISLQIALFLYFVLNLFTSIADFLDH